MVSAHLLVAVTAASLVSAVLAEYVSVRIYWTTVEMFNSESQPRFKDAIEKEAMIYCNEEQKQSNRCGDMVNVSLSAHVWNVTQSRYDIDTWVAISLESDKDMMLPAKSTTSVLNRARESIVEDTGLQVIRIGEEKYGVKADDPNNLIISVVFLVLTLILLAVTIYLVKFRVNHAQEHFEERKVLNGSEIEA